MGTIQMVATDLDGTLLNSHLLVSEKIRQIIKGLKAKGMHIVLCTGRPFNGMAHLIDELGLDAEDFTVTYNGSLVQSCDNRFILHEAHLSPLNFQTLARFFNHFGLGLHAMTRGNMYTYDQAVHPLTVRESYLGNLPLHILLEGELVEENIIKMMAVGDPEQLDQAILAFRKQFGSQFSINKSEAYYLEIMQKGDDKARALELLLEELNLNADHLMAFGNNQNDLEMIKLAKVGVAVGNAVPELKRGSDFITKTNAKMV